MTLTICMATQDHQCDLCDQPIPKGDKYWSDDEYIGNGEFGNLGREHTNCELYKQEPTANE